MDYLGGSKSMTNVLTGGTEKTFAHSRGSGPHPPYSFCLLTDWHSPLCPSMVSRAPSLGICGNNKLSFQWQSSELLAPPHVSNNKTYILKLSLRQQDKLHLATD